MDVHSFEDKLELFGALGGAFLIIMGLVALASTPWRPPRVRRRY